MTKEKTDKDIRKEIAIVDNLTKEKPLIDKIKYRDEFPKPHYLLEKDIEKWDEYDWGNFRSIVNKIIWGYKL